MITAQLQFYFIRNTGYFIMAAVQSALILVSYTQTYCYVVLYCVIYEHRVIYNSVYMSMCSYETPCKHKSALHYTWRACCGSGRTIGLVSHNIFFSTKCYSLGFWCHIDNLLLLYKMDVWTVESKQ